MNTSMKFTQILAAAAFIFGSTLGLHAASTHIAGGTSPTPADSGQKAAAEAAEVTTLRPIFTLLQHADHDYQGHRIKAMRAIAAACRMMGTDIMPAGAMGGRGRGRGAGTGTAAGTNTTAKPATTQPEQQTLSDEQLHQAQATIQQVRNGIAGGTQSRIAARLDEAIQEIGIALTVK